MKKYLLGLLLLWLVACSPTAPAAQLETPPEVNEAIQPTSEVALTIPEGEVQQVDPVTWEYKTLSVSTGNNEQGVFIELYQSMDTCESGGTGNGRVCFLEDANEGLATELNKLGSEGWELVDVIYEPGSVVAIAFFKRPVRNP